MEPDGGMSMRACLSALALVSAVTPALADETTSVTETTTTTTTTEKYGTAGVEVGLFGGGFISSVNHQFYNEGNVASRDELDRVSFQAGLRVAKFFSPYFGLELEGATTFANTKNTDVSLRILGVGGQAILQFPARITPFVGIGAVAAITNSEVLGTDIDALLHIGGGVKLWLTKSVALRLDGRFMRGPSSMDPYTLDTSHGQFTVGLAFGAKTTKVEKTVVVENKDPDGDGIIAPAEQCPNEAEDKDGFQDEDGCPDNDNDADGVADAADRCPLDAEDLDGFEDDDGCPDADNDADGIGDASDKCPMEAEDMDGFQDDDGCPDADNDDDGILDGVDKCPTEAEVKNNYIDGDGCPDEVPAAVKQFTGVIQGINFRTNDAALIKTSFRQLDKAVEVLKQFPDMSIEIQGHTDDQAIKKSKKNKFQTNLELSQARAESVAAYFESKGIAKDRLIAKGYGDTAPLVDPKGLKGGKLTAARAKNRRVEFQLINR